MQRKTCLYGKYRPSSSVKLLEKLKPLEVNLCERADYGAELRKANVLPA